MDLIVLIAIACLSFSGNLEGSVPADGTPQAIPEISVCRRRYVETLTSFAVIDYRYHVISKMSVGKNQSPHRTDFRFVSDGVRELYTSEEDIPSGEGRQIARSVSDGRTYSHWMKLTKPKGLPLPTGGIEQKRPVVHGGHMTLGKLMGERIWGGDRSLRQLLDGPIQVLGWETIDGLECVKIDCGSHPVYPGSEDATHQTTAWLAPSHGYLPKRLFTRELKDQVAKPLHWDFHISEFRECSPAGQGDVSLWYPSSAKVLHPYTLIEVEIDSLTIPSVIPAAIFDVQFPPGTYVYESLAGRQPRYFVTGGVSGQKLYDDAAAKYAAEITRKEKERKVSSEEDRASGESSNAIATNRRSARPSDMSRVPISGILAVAGILLLIGVWIWRNRL
ncbi:MAG: hypothetical protein Q8K78_06595 [Planctomycetaceae bacterium]|nr:hypothetical protein [Planctomycetaceae bacterium]